MKALHTLCRAEKGEGYAVFQQGNHVYFSCYHPLFPYLLLATSHLDTFHTWSPTDITITNNDATVFLWLKPTHAIRRTCSRFVASRSVQISWGVLVCLSTAMALAIQPRYDMGHPTYLSLFSIQLICVVFFWARMGAEIIASGLIEGSHSFLRSWWNWVELVVNVFSLLQVIPPTFHIRWIRGFAALRPLRFFLYVPCWRQKLIPLGRSFPCMFDVMITLGLCLVALALVGVMEVGEDLYQRCYITKTTAASPYAALKLPFLLRNISAACGAGLSCPPVSSDVTVECLTLEHARSDDFLTYQHIGSALLLLFKVASMDLWFEDLEDVMNVKGPGAALYLVVVVIVALFFFALLTSVVYNAYANFDMSYAPPVTVNSSPTARGRQDRGMQTLSLRPQLPQLSSTRATYMNPHTSLADDLGQSEVDVRELNPLSPEGGAEHVSICASCTHGESTLVSQESQRDMPDSIGAHPLIKFLISLRDTESTTTPAAGTTPTAAFLASLVSSVPFAITLLVLSTTNVVLLAAISTSTPRATASILRKVSGGLSIFFIVPVSLRLISFGVRRTSSDFWNYVDVLGATSGVVELAAPTFFHYRVVGALRALRFIRLVKYFIPVYCDIRLFKSLVSLFFLILVTLSLYALLGVQLFAGAYSAAAPPAPIRNGDFTTTWTALLACFRALTGDTWTRYMVTVSKGGSIVTGSLFFISLRLFSCVALFALGQSVIILAFHDVALAEDALRSQEYPPLLLLPPIKMDDIVEAAVPVDGEGSPSLDFSVAAGWWQRRFRARSTLGGKLAGRYLRARGDAFFFMEPLNPIRLMLLRVLGSPFYTLISVLCVVLGAVALFFERRRLDARTERALHFVNIAYLVVFGMEMVVKWFAYGVVSPGPHPREDLDQQHAARYMPAYFMCPLNWVDFAANGLSVAALFHPHLRIGRVIRTVRLFTTQELPNRSFLELLKVFRQLVKFLPLIIFVYVALAIAGMQMFSGALVRCNDPVITDEELCVGEYSTTVMGYTGPTTILQKRTKERAAFHYDAFGPALLSVFSLTTANHWGYFMNDAMAITSGLMSYNSSGYYVFFFIVALLAIRFFAIGTIAAVLVVGVRRMMINFTTTPGRAHNRAKFTASRESIVYMTRLQCTVQPLPTTVSRLFHRILSTQLTHWPNTVFGIILQAVLLVVCVFLSSTNASEALWQKRVVLGMYSIGVSFCGAEVMMTAWAYGLRHFCRAWYLVDGALFTAMIVSFLSPRLYCMRVVIFVKLIKDASTGLSLLPGMRHIPILLSSCAMGILVLFTYAVVGTVLFGDIAPDGAHLTEQRNFTTVLRSLLLLFNCSTFDEWHLVMHACFDGAACRNDASATCGHTSSAVFFFVSFIVAQSLLVGQLMLASVVAAFTSPLDLDVIKPFIQLRDVWRRCVGAGEFSCDLDTFLSLLPRLPVSLTDGISTETASEADMFAFLSSLRIPLDENLQLRYEHFLRGFAYRRYKIDLIDHQSDLRPHNRLARFTIGEYYGQLLLRKYCGGVSRLAQTELDGVRRLSAEIFAESLTQDTAGGNDVFGLHGDDLRIPKGALPIPNCNIFLYTFPGESNDIGAFPPRK